MNKLFLSIFVFALSALSLTAFSQNPFPSIDLDCNYSSGGYGTSTGRPRTPVNPPLVYQDDLYSLYLDTNFNMQKMPVLAWLIIDFSMNSTKYQNTEK